MALALGAPWQQSPQTTNYTTNSLNEYTAVGGTTQVSDANGNLTDDGTHLFLYDYKNHIVQVKDKSSGSVIAGYKYDALGRRVEKNVGGTVERYILSIWSEPGVVEDLSHVVSVFDGSDNWKQNFVWSDEVDGIQMLEQADVLDYDTDGNTTEVTRSFYHRNALGSVMEVTDMNQAAVVSYRYDPYGKVTITRGGTPQSSDPLGNHWTFTGRFLDEESGLLYYRARYYDPATGRFLQRDPLGYMTGPSLFEYCDSAPVSWADPSGCESDAERKAREARARAIEAWIKATEEGNEPLAVKTAKKELLKEIEGWARGLWDRLRGKKKKPPSPDGSGGGGGFRPYGGWDDGPFGGIRGRYPIGGCGWHGGGRLGAGLRGFQFPDEPLGNEPYVFAGLELSHAWLKGRFAISVGVELGPDGKPRGKAGFTLGFDW